MKGMYNHSMKLIQIFYILVERMPQQYHLPTIPNKTQYTAANIAKGIDAKKAPNFPDRK